ncbi:Lysophospholipid transporter LplT [compost metagenome]
MSSSFTLLSQRRFAPFFLTQLSTALTDNVLKQVLLLLVTYNAASYSTMDPGLLTNLAAGLFILPFVLLSAPAGQLADKFDKARLIQVVKGAEICIMALASWGFLTHNIVLLLASLFLMGCHSAFFGPAKYAILPQVLHPDELIAGNGLLEMGTFLAILGGTIGAGLLVAATTEPAVLSLTLTAMSVVGFACSVYIPPVPAPAPALKVSWNIFSQTAAMVRHARSKRAVWLSILGISWFWFFGSMLLTQIPAIGKTVLHGSEAVITLLLAVFAVGVAVGSLLCERLSGNRVEIGLVPFGSIGMTLFALDLYFALSGFPAGASGAGVTQLLADWRAWRVLADVALIGAFGGFYIVPLYALVQLRTDKSHQSRVIAVNNILNAAFMVGAAGLAAVLLAMGASVLTLILVCAVLNAAVAIYIYGLVPEFLWRFLGWVLAHTVYRVRLKGRELIPQEGAAILAPNHVTYADALFLFALSPRPIRFVSEHTLFSVPLVGRLLRRVKAIPIASGKTHPHVLAQALEDVDRALKAGELVCLFPEGRLSRDGKLGAFRPGLLKVLERTPVPVYPVALAGLHGSTFCPDQAGLAGRVLRWRPRRIVRVSVASAIAPGDVTTEGLRSQVASMLDEPLR